MAQRLHLMLFFLWGRWVWLAFQPGTDLDLEADRTCRLTFSSPNGAPDNLPHFRPQDALLTDIPSNPSSSLCRYYTLALRLVGARTMFTRRLEGQQRASYFVIGVFILLELSLCATSGLARAARAHLAEGRVNEVREEIFFFKVP